MGVSEVFHDLEQAFLNAIQIQLPDTKTQYEEGVGAFPSYLREVGAELPSLSAAFFDGLVEFDDKMSRPTLSD